MKIKLSQLFKKSFKGATGIEYAIVASLIAVVAVVAMQKFGSSISSNFKKIANNIENNEGASSEKEKKKESEVKAEEEENEEEPP